MLQDEKTNQIFNGDCLIELDKVEDKSVQLVLIDPPYNIGKDDWDNFGKVKKGYKNHREAYSGESYFDFMEKVFIKLEPKLKDNGSLFFFHNDFRIMSRLDLIVEDKTNLIQRNFLIWNKRFDGAKKKGFLDGFIVKGGMTCFNKMAEYMLFYTFDNSWKLRQKRLELNITQSTIAKEIKSKTGKVTGWYSNLETGKNLPTRETIVPIEKYLGLTYDDIVPKFCNQKTHHSVWEYDLDHKKEGHITPKPIKLLKNIIEHTTDENEIVLDCFMGSGSTGVACNEINRKFIGIEKNKKYFDLAKKRISNSNTIYKFL
jgi:site-specific DNA-methyltransferase (adenine-specific)